MFVQSISSLEQSGRISLASFSDLNVTACDVVSITPSHNYLHNCHIDLLSHMENTVCHCFVFILQCTLLNHNTACSNLQGNNIFDN